MSSIVSKLSMSADTKTTVVEVGKEALNSAKELSSILQADGVMNDAISKGILFLENVKGDGRVKYGQLTNGKDVFIDGARLKAALDNPSITAQISNFLEKKLRIRKEYLGIAVKTIKGLIKISGFVGPIAIRLLSPLLISVGIPPPILDVIFNIYKSAATMLTDKMDNDLTLEILTQRPAVTGGDDNDDDYYTNELKLGAYYSIMGGADKEVEDEIINSYGSSISSEKKKKIIQGIIDVFTSIGFADSSITCDENGVKAMLKLLPDNKAKKFTTDPALFTKMCRAVGNKINEVNGKIINMGVEPELICKQVSEFIGSLSAGMHSEFLIVHNNVRNTIKNSEYLIDIMKQVFQKFETKVNATNDTELKTDINVMRSLHVDVVNELERQIKMLQNLLNVHLLPQEKSIGDLMKLRFLENGKIENLDNFSPGNFGMVLSNVMRGLGMTAQLAALIDNALTKVGMNRGEYQKTNFSDLVLKLSENTSKHVGKNEDLTEYLNAIQLLQDNFHLRNKLTTGGNEPAYIVSTIERTAMNAKKARHLLLGAFHQQISALYSHLVTSVMNLTKHVGTVLPNGDELDVFRLEFGRMLSALALNKDVYFALSGYYNSSLEQSKKTEFLGRLNGVIEVIDKLLRNEKYKNAASHFEEIKLCIRSIMQLVDKYTEQFKTGTFSGGDGENITLFQGGAGEEPVIEQFNVLNETFQSSLVKFDMHMRNAMLTHNISAANKDLDKYALNYEKLTAMSIAERINSINSEKESYLTHPAITFIGGGGGPFTEMSAVIEYFKTNATVAAAINADAKWAAANLTEMKKLYEEQIEARINFWQTIESIDGYLRSFTKDLTLTPNEIKDIKGMLNEVGALNDWYNDTTGTNFNRAFDNFPAYVRGGGVYTDTSVDVNTPMAVDAFTYPSTLFTKGVMEHHYYKIFGALSSPTAEATVTINGDFQQDRLPNANTLPRMMPGNHYIGNTAKRTTESKLHLKKMFNGFSVLKNLISLFVHIGGKYGRTQQMQFKSPAQIYQSLVNYLINSAYTFSHDGISSLISVDGNGTLSAAPNTVNGVISSFENGSINIGSVTNVDNILTQYKKYTNVTMRSSTLDGFRGNANQQMEDTYFNLTMKAVCSKIFTVIGTYKLFNSSHENYIIEPVRYILGGNDLSPKVDTANTDLYFRLPLLAQFYRRLFVNDTEQTNQFKNYAGIKTKDTNLRISMIPDVDGIFGTFIKIMFRDMQNIQNNSMTDQDLFRLISEINHIRSKFASNQEVYDAFVRDINQKYGMVTRSVNETYEREMGKHYDAIVGRTDRYAERPDNTYKILPGEGEVEANIPTPSSQYIRINSPSTVAYQNVHNITEDHRKLVYDFRCIIDKELSVGNRAVSFKFAINNARTLLDKEQNGDKRYKIIADLIRGSELYTNADKIKYAVLQETVLAPLNIVAGIYTLIFKATQRLALLDLKSIRECYWKAIKKLTTTLDNYTYTELINMVFDELKLVYKILGEDNRILFYEIFRASGTKISQHAILRAANSGAPPASELTVSDNVLQTCYTFPKHQTYFDGTGAANEAINIVGADPTQATSRIKLNGVDTLSNQVRGINGDTAAGLFGLLLGHNITNEVTNENIKNTFYRYAIDNELIMRELLESLYGLHNDSLGLIKLDVSASSFTINSGGLRKIVTELLDVVQTNLQTIRPYLESSVTNLLTNKLNSGSIYFIQERLVEQLLNGRAESGESGNIKNKYLTLDASVNIANTTYKLLNQSYTVNCDNIINGAASTLNTCPAEQIRYGHVIERAMFYDTRSRNCNIIPSEKNTKNYGNQLLQETAFQIQDPNAIDDREWANLAVMTGDGTTVDLNLGARNKDLYTWDDDLTCNRSALFMFNQLVAKYTKMCFNISGGKIYIRSIESFATGSYSNQVGDINHTWCDVLPVRRNGTNPTGGATGNIQNRTIVINQSNTITLTDWMSSQRLGVSGTFNISGVPKHFGATIPDRGRDGLFIPYTTRAAVDAVANDVPPVLDSTFCESLKTYAGELESRDFNTWEEHVGIFGARYEPHPQKLLFTSLSTVLRNLIGLKTRQNTSRHIVDTLIDVPIFMKERYRCNMPLFKKMFEGLIKRCDFYRTIVNRKDFNAGRYFSENDTIKAVNVNGTLSTFTAAVAAPTNIDIGSGGAPFNHPAFAGGVITPAQITTVFNKQSLFYAATVRSRPDLMNPLTKSLVKPSSDSNETKNRISAICDGIINGCTGIIKCCDLTLRELADTPKLGELGVDSIRDYKNLNGHEPFIPLSNSLYCLNNVTDARSEIATLPLHYNGVDEFKLMYAARGIFANNENVDTANFTGWNNLIEEHNILGSSGNFDKTKSDKTLHSILTGLRYIYEIKKIKGTLTHNLFYNDIVANIATVQETNISRKVMKINPYADGDRISGTLNNAAYCNSFKENLKQLTSSDYPSGSWMRCDLISSKPSIRAGPVDNRNQFAIYDYKTRKQQIVTYNENFHDIDNFATNTRNIAPEPSAPPAVYALSRIPSEVVRITENPDTNYSLRLIMDNIINRDDAQVIKMDVQNIIDMNIIPINVHGLMRDIPLANIYNYAYTFDRMLIDHFYQGNVNNSEKIMLQLCDTDAPAITTTTDFLISTTMNPYQPINDNTVDFLIRMFLGDDNSGMGRPKFLSDQLFNKLLFGELYTLKEKYDERGPVFEKFDKRRLVSTIAAIILQLDSQENKCRTLNQPVAIYPTTPFTGILNGRRWVPSGKHSNLKDAVSILMDIIGQVIDLQVILDGTGNGATVPVKSIYDLFLLKNGGNAVNGIGNGINGITNLYGVTSLIIANDVDCGNDEWIDGLAGGTFHGLTVANRAGRLNVNFGFIHYQKKLTLHLCLLISNLCMTMTQAHLDLPNAKNYIRSIARYGLGLNFDNSGISSPFIGNPKTVAVLAALDDHLGYITANAAAVQPGGNSHNSANKIWRNMHRVLAIASFSCIPLERDVAVLNNTNLLNGYYHEAINTVPAAGNIPVAHNDNFNAFPICFAGNVIFEAGGYKNVDAIFGNYQTRIRRMVGKAENVGTTLGGAATGVGSVCREYITSAIGGAFPGMFGVANTQNTALRPALKYIQYNETQQATKDLLNLINEYAPQFSFAFHSTTDIPLDLVLEYQTKINNINWGAPEGPYLATVVASLAGNTNADAVAVNYAVPNDRDSALVFRQKIIGTMCVGGDQLNKVHICTATATYGIGCSGINDAGVAIAGGTSTVNGRFVDDTRMENLGEYFNHNPTARIADPVLGLTAVMPCNTLVGGVHDRANPAVGVDSRQLGRNRLLYMSGANADIVLTNLSQSPFVEINVNGSINSSIQKTFGINIQSAQRAVELPAYPIADNRLIFTNGITPANAVTPFLFDNNTCSRLSNLILQTHYVLSTVAASAMADTAAALNVDISESLHAIYMKSEDGGYRLRSTTFMINQAAFNAVTKGGLAIYHSIVNNSTTAVPLTGANIGQAACLTNSLDAATNVALAGFALQTWQFYLRTAFTGDVSAAASNNYLQNANLQTNKNANITRQTKYLHYLEQQTDDTSTDRNARYADDLRVFKPTQLQKVNIETIAPYLNIIGKLRFDSVIVRNVCFITNLFRICRSKLHHDLTYTRDPIVHDMQMLHPQVTEYANNQVYREQTRGIDNYARNY